MAREKRALLHNPWASIIPRDPSQPQLEFVIVPAVNRAMWATEEYAIKAFKSGCRRHVRPVEIAPIREIDMIG